ncbi:MAG: hypothetical protein R3E66_21065 [bacterium]
MRSAVRHIPAVQVGAVTSTPAPPDHDELDDRDSGPVSGELPTQMWNPADELDSDETDDRRSRKNSG